jgi:hypothetical protein
MWLKKYYRIFFFKANDGGELTPIILPVYSKDDE